MTYKPTFGSISHGTLRAVDLIGNFAYELDFIRQKGSLLSEDHAALIERASEREDDILAMPENETESDQELVTELMDALNEYAPAYAYFGAHPGDGSDFGFWPDMDAIEELPRIDDPGEHAGEECVFVNDHGNVTVYAADGSVIWDCV